MPGIETSVTSTSIRSVASRTELQRTDAVGRRQHLEALALEDARRELAHDLLVVDDERARRRGDGPRRGRPARRTALGASASGRCTTNVDPFPGSVSSRMKPPLCVTVPYTLARPSPAPSPTAFVVKNGSKTRAFVSSSIPSPVSATERNA